MSVSWVLLPFLRLQHFYVRLFFVACFLGFLTGLSAGGRMRAVASMCMAVGRREVVNDESGLILKVFLKD